MAEARNLEGSVAASASRDDNRSGLRALAEARESGMSTVQRLAEQAEALESAESVANSNQYIIDRSARVVRGMTWSGWVRNIFTNPPAPPAVVATSSTSVPKASMDNAAEEESRKALFASAGGGGGRGRDGGGANKAAAELEQESYIASISKSLDDLLVIGQGIGTQLDDQNDAAIIPRLRGKIDKLWETTRAVTREAGLVAETGICYTPKMVGHVVLRCTKTKRHVTARGVDVALSVADGNIRASSVMALFERRAGLMGLQCLVSGRWLGIGYIGSAVRCASSKFGRWEEFDLDLDAARNGRPTPLLSVGANWGSGCWLRVDCDGYLVPSAAALDQAALFDVIFIDENFELPKYAEQILLRKGEASSLTVTTVAPSPEQQQKTVASSRLS